MQHFLPAASTSQQSNLTSASNANYMGMKMDRRSIDGHIITHEPQSKKNNITLDLSGGRKRDLQGDEPVAGHAQLKSALKKASQPPVSTSDIVLQPVNTSQASNNTTAYENVSLLLCLPTTFMPFRALM